MIITPNQLLYSTNKFMKFYDCSMVVVDGPNTIGKMGLQNMNIPYDNYFVSRMTLQPGDEEIPIMYGFLGTEITYLMVKANYNVATSTSCSSNSTSCGSRYVPPNCTAEDYLTYSFTNEPLESNVMGPLLVLSGTRNHKIPQVYMYNPTDKVVELDVLCANLGENTVAGLVSEGNLFRGLFYYSVISNLIPDNYGNTGSTQLEILDLDENVQLVIPYIEIDLVEQDANILYISTNLNSLIELEFVSTFHANQANSRINWVVKDYLRRYLTVDYPTMDVDAPVITFIPHPVNTLPLGDGISREEIIDYFIYDITDVRDGTIYKEDVTVEIAKSGSLRALTGITTDGEYTITFTVMDLAANTTIEVTDLIVDGTAPVIYYTDASSGNSMDLAVLPDPGSLVRDDLIEYYITSIWDNVDGVIPTSELDISGLTFPVSGVGYYNFDFVVADRAGNITTNNKTLHVWDSEAAPVFYWNDVSDTVYATASGYTGLTNTWVGNYYLSAVTDAFDGIIPISAVTVVMYDSGSTITSVIVTGGTYSIDFSVTNSYGNSSQTYKTLVAEF